MKDLPGTLFYKEGSVTFPFDEVPEVETLLSTPLPSFVPQEPVSVLGAWRDSVRPAPNTPTEPVLVLRILDASGETVRMIVPYAEIDEKDLPLFDACLEEASVAKE